MGNSRNNSRLFWIGLGVGVVAGFILNSDKGRRLQKDASEKAKEYGDQIKETGQQQIDQLSQNVNKWVEQGQFYAKNLQSIAKNNLESVASPSEEESAFERGKRKAKTAIELQEAKIEHAVKNKTI